MYHFNSFTISYNLASGMILDKNVEHLWLLDGLGLVSFLHQVEAVIFILYNK